MTAADKYFLKAKDNYPYNLDEALEALEYGLSCDSEHAGLLTLQGTIYFEDLRRYDAARECFESALCSDPLYVDAYYGYIRLAIWTDEVKTAQKLITTALKIAGVDKALVHYFDAILAERQWLYVHAANSLKKAKESCLSKKCYSFYEEEIERVEQKDKHLKESRNVINILLVS